MGKKGNERAASRFDRKPPRYAMNIETVILDMDGVVFRGQSAIPGAREAVDAMEREGLGVFFLTNNGSRTRKHFLGKLLSAGIRTSEEKVYSTSYGAVKYIEENFPGKSVYVINEMARDEFLEAGLACEESEKAEVVVAGLDRKLTYEKLALAFRAIVNGAEFIATNEDPSYPVEDGLLPGAGAIVAALAYSTGRKPIVVGKPEPYMLDLIVREHGLEKGKALMVGDKLETDILMAKEEGMVSALVLTGVTSRAEAMQGRIKPDFVLDSIREIPGMIRNLEATRRSQI
ncbi:MAG: HAD-IIA family hydrolase [Candidatus Micrarchaeota archaeon]